MNLIVGLLAALGTALLLSRRSHSVRRNSKVSARDLQRVLVAVISALFLQLLLGVVVLSAISAVMVFWVYQRIGQQREERLVRARAEAWPDVLETLVSGVRAGMSLPSALVALEGSDPQALKPLLQPLYVELRHGSSTVNALHAWRNAAADPIVDRIALALTIATGVGGRALPTVLLNLATFLRSEARTRAELVARQSWTVNAARLAVAAPWLMVLILGLRARDAYQSPTGAIVLIAGAAATWIGYEWMSALAKLPRERRIFA
jgi:tight adherence protein B